MDNLKINSFKAYWDLDNKFGRIDLYFSNGQKLETPQLSSGDFVAMLSILQFSNTSWHVPTRSLVKA